VLTECAPPCPLVPPPSVSPAPLPACELRYSGLRSGDLLRLRSAGSWSCRSGLVCGADATPLTRRARVASPCAFSLSPAKDRARVCEAGFQFGVGTNSRTSVSLALCSSVPSYGSRRVACKRACYFNFLTGECTLFHSVFPVPYFVDPHRYDSVEDDFFLSCEVMLFGGAQRVQPSLVCRQPWVSVTCFGRLKQLTRSELLAHISRTGNISKTNSLSRSQIRMVEPFYCNGGTWYGICVRSGCLTMSTDVRA
jgi:hypothetical protein